MISSCSLSERTWRDRTKIGREIGEKTAAVLDHAAPSDDTAMRFQKRFAERALTEEGGNVFTEYERLGGGEVLRGKCGRTG